MYKDTRKTVRQFIADNYLYREGLDTLGDDDSFLETGILDSMGILELVTYLEQTFGIKIPDEELLPENLDSIALVASYVHRKQESA